jgi:methylsterol monooxygenase
MSFNATLLPPKVAHPTAAELYSAAGTDFDSLSTMEQWWVQWYLYFGDPIIATGLLSFIMHEVRLSYFPKVV